MECIYCGAELGRDDKCPHCRADVRLYKKIIYISNYYYNEGLARASVRNLTGAIESLNQSLRYNKMNIDARNLLGLVYYEVGEAVSALGEWVISRSMQSRDNIAENYLNAVQKNQGRLDSMNQTIKKYNQALLYCRQDSKDLATIQLKKVLTMNPKLVKAHQLLALLYIEEGKMELALKELRAAAKIDNGNTVTMRYMREVNSALRAEAKNKKGKSKKDDLVSYKSGNETIIQPTHVRDGGGFSTIINIVIGVVIGACITGFLFVPSVRQSAQKEMNLASKEANDTLAEKNQNITALESQIEELTKQVEEAAETNEASEVRLESYEQLLNAYVAYTQKDIETAGTALGKVNVEDLTTNARGIYESMSVGVDEEYIQQLYTTGYEAYNQQNYEEAATNLQKVVDAEEDYENGNAIYNLAHAYRSLDEKEKAIYYYQKMVELHPGTERGANAQKYLDSLLQEQEQ